MRTPLIGTVVACLALNVAFSSFCVAQSEKEMKAYPPAEPGMQRYVLHLPQKDDESLLKVELMVGKTQSLDSINRYFFGGKLEEQTIEGWGYPSFVLKQLGPLLGTRIGVDPALPKVDRFVSLGGEAYLIRYNSRLPIVLYVPEGVEVRYRVWKTTANAEPMNQG